MHKVIVLLAALLMSAGSSAGEEIPELEEWLRITGDTKGGYVAGIFTYLPDFDKAGGGINAIGTINLPQTAANDWPTWYLRNQQDTINQFDWPNQATGQITRVDLNGDGVYEYLNYMGGVHTTVSNGVPPQREPVAVYDNTGASTPSLQRVVVDINVDGKEDVIIPPGYFADPWLAVVLFGGEDVTKLRTQVIWRRKQGKQNEFLLGVLPQKVGGKVRLISRSYEEAGFQQAKWVSYVLRELSAVPSGDTVRFELTTLDSISDAAVRPEYSYGLFDAVLHQSKFNEPVFLLAPVIGRNAVEVYDLSAGNFRKVQDFSTGEVLRYPSFTIQSINGDDYEDWRTATTITSTNKTEYIFHAGQRGDRIDTIGFAKVTFSCPLGEGISTYGIGDVTGDGIGDVGIAVNNTMGCFAIYKGVARRTVGVPEAVAGYSRLRFAMQQNYPNPVPSNGSALLPIDIEQPGEYTLRLYTLQGKLVHEFYRGVLQVGRYQMPLEFAGLGLAPGFYALRLGDGTRQCERGVLVQ